MNLKNKITVLLVSVYLLLLIIFLGQRAFFDIPELKSLQVKSDFNEVERVVRSLDYQQVEVSRMAYDYAVWDDTYQFVNQFSEDYVGNYIGDTFDSLSINGIYIMNLSGDLIWSGGYLNNRLMENPKAHFADPATLQKLAYQNLDDELQVAMVQRGLITGQNQLMVYARVTILPTNIFGYPRGTFIMVRLLTPELVGQLSKVAQLEFHVYQMRDVGNEKHLASMTPELDLLEDHEVLRRQQFGYRWLKDEKGTPVALLEVELSPAMFDGSLIDTATGLVLLLATITMVFIRMFLEFLVIQPLDHLKAHLQRVRETSNYSLRMDSSRQDEIGLLADECDKLVDYVSAQENYLKTINHDLTKKALEDGLTEVANRRHFDVKYELLWRAYQQSQRPIYVVLLDVDNFKSYNDNYGHLKGDETLKAIADELLSNVRVNTDMVARYGGEEFVVLLTETDIAGVKIVCEKLLAAIRTLNISHEYSDVSSRVTVSIGVAGWTPGSEDPKAMLEAADTALLDAKRAGRDCVQYHIRDDSLSR
ncbi:MAG: diguanylate cyclase [Pseudomonadales bacterium]|nr:diguanylate cyclase [Pseudomonadales bacterium]